MKFVISKADIWTLLNKIQNVVPTKPTMPILSNCLMEVANNELTITATDLTVGIRCYSPAKVLVEGATTLPAKRVAQLLRELTTSNVEVSCNEHHLTEIAADSSLFKLHGMCKSEFPALPDLSESLNFKIKQKDLKELLYRTCFAVSREDNRFVLTGVLLRLYQSKITCIGTDGKRLAKISKNVEAEPTWKGEYIIPLKAVEEFIKNLNEDEESMATVYLMADKVAVDANQTLMMTKLLIGEYPNVDLVIPAQTDINVSLLRDELIVMLRQISLFAEETSVRFSFLPGELKITATSGELGEGKVSMPINYQGERLDIAFNPNYLLDILRHCKEESITLGLTDSYNPGIILEGAAHVDIAVANPIFVLMPLRLSEE